jgi:hypothetical protein
MRENARQHRQTPRLGTHAQSRTPAPSGGMQAAGG